MNESQHSIPLSHKIVPPLLLSLLAALVYYPSLHYDFQFDDVANIKKHFDIRHYSLSKLFFSGTRWVSYWLNSLHYQIGRFDPFSYRVGNVLIHILNGILIFCIVLTALSLIQKADFFKRNRLGIALTTSMLFLLHPVQTQTISYVIQGQLEGLAMLFTLALSLCFLHITTTSNLITKTLLTQFFFFLSILAYGTKEIAIVTPLLIILIDWFFVAQGSWHSFKNRLLFHCSFFVLTLFVYVYLLKPKFFMDLFGLKMAVKNNIGNVITHTQDEIITPGKFFISQFKVMLHYLWIFIWPAHISVEYDWILCKSIFAFDCLAPLTVLIGLAWYTIKTFLRNQAHPFVFGITWFFVCIIPRSSIIPSPELLVDYKTYVASFGWLLILASCLVYLFEYLRMRLPHTRYAAYYSSCAITLCALLIASITVERNKVWRSGLDFWENMVKNAPGKARTYNNYGVELSQNLHEFEKAIPYFKKAIKMDKKYPDPWNNLAVCYAQLNQIDNAIKALQQGLRIHPHYPEGWNNLAAFFIQQEKLVEAERCLKNALSLRPHYGKAYYNLGRLHLKKEDNEKAWEAFKNCCTIADLDNEAGFSHFAKVSFVLKKYDDALAAYQQALALNPHNNEYLFNIANCYYIKQEYTLAADCYQKLLARDPSNFKAWYNLGESFYALAQPHQALAAYLKIHHMKLQLPNIYIRMAACHEQLGNIQQARALLSELITVPMLSDHNREVGSNLLAQLDKRYYRK